jgi:hypothetical protein
MVKFSQAAPISQVFCPKFSALSFLPKVFCPKFLPKAFCPKFSPECPALPKILKGRLTQNSSPLRYVLQPGGGKRERSKAIFEGCQTEKIFEKSSPSALFIDSLETGLGKVAKNSLKLRRPGADTGF